MIVKRILIGLAVLALSVSHVNAELVGLWQFEKEVDPQPDSSPFGNDAEVIDADWIDDPDRGGVMRFNGDGNGNPVSWLEVEDSDSLSIEETGLTIAAWANFEQFDTWNSIVAKTGAGAQNKPSPYDVYTHQNGDGRVSFFGGEGAGNIQQINSDSSPEAEVWTHIAVTLTEDGDLFHYLDGEENGEGFYDRDANPLIDEDQNLFIGSRLDGTTNMHGFLDDVAIFNQALTQGQIQTIMGGDFSEFIGGGTPGDFNNDGELTVDDIDTLTQAICDGSQDTRFDLNGDGNVDTLDRDFWVEDESVRHTWSGDANLDGEFNSSDFVQVFQRGEYEDAIEDNSTWGDGDWNGDKDFNSSDFVKAFQGGGFEMGPRWQAVANVPEPSAFILLLCGILPLIRIRRR